MIANTGPAALDRRAARHYKPDAVTEASQPQRDQSRPTGAARIGRMAGVLTFWLMAVYFIGASVYSVTSALFGDGLDVNGSAEESRCARELSALNHDLYESAADSLRTGVRAGSLTWTHEWDRRHAELNGRCGPLSPQHADLKTLRTDVGELLRNHQRNSAGPRRSLKRTLEAIVPSS